MDLLRNWKGKMIIFLALKDMLYDASYIVCGKPLLYQSEKTCINASSGVDLNFLFHNVIINTIVGSHSYEQRSIYRLQEDVMTSSNKERKSRYLGGPSITVIDISCHIGRGCRYPNVMWVLAGSFFFKTDCVFPEWLILNRMSRTALCVLFELQVTLRVQRFLKCCTF